jgi:hypothetical protein
MSKMIIGFHGIAGSGKDTAAISISKHQNNVEIMAFAKPLKDACKILFNFTDSQLYDPIKKEEVDPVWEKSPRKILQWLGTDILREHINKEFFTINMKQRIEESEAEFIVISDVRFDNEAELIKGLGGYIINIVRENATTTQHSSHVTEQGITPDLIDHTITNDGTLEEFHNKVGRLIKLLKYHS